MRIATACIGVAVGVGLLAPALAAPEPAPAAVLKAETLRAWNAYVAAAEARVDGELHGNRGFLTPGYSPSRASLAERARVLGGETVIVRLDSPDGGKTTVAVPAGRIHHWRGAVFLRGVDLDTLLAWLEDPPKNAPLQEDVLETRVLGRQGDDLTVFMKLRRKEIVTVTYNTVHAVRYVRGADGRAASRSVATKVAELADAGTPAEREKPVGHDSGFMWRLNSYWRYEQAPGGVVAQCESLTLSRGVPFLLAPLANPIIDGVARESMEKALVYLRNAKGAGVPRGTARRPTD
jgi:hypothetical protein